MKNIKFTVGILLIGSLLLLAPAAHARNCKYALLGDFTASVGPTDDPTRINVDAAEDAASCPGKKYCDGQMMCQEDDGKFTFKEVHCLAQGDGRCPRSFDCDTDQKKGALGKQADYEGKGVPKNLSPLESDADQVGTQCGRINSDLGKAKCNEFCADRCAKFLAATPEKVSICANRVIESCHAPIIDDNPSGGGGNQAGGR
jgi:hypothetical protein